MKKLFLLFILLNTINNAVFADSVLNLQVDEDSWNGTSNEVVDSSGNGHHGTSNGGAETASNGKFGRAGDFTGNGDYVDLRVNGVMPVELSFTSFDAWTLTAWVYWENNPDNYWDFWIGKNGNSEMFSIASTGIIMFRQSDLNYVNLLYNYSFYENQWAHHAYVADGNGNLSFYLNGVLQNTVSATTQFHLENIGRPYNGNEFNGYIDDVMLYNHALNSADVKQNYNNDHKVLYLQMDESIWNGTSNEVVDSSGNGYHGTANGGAVTTANGKFGRAGDFTGNDDYVDLRVNGVTPAELSFTSSDAWTLSAWIKWQNNTATYYEFWTGASTTELFSFTDNSGTIQFRQNDFTYVTLMNNYSAYENQWAYHTYVANGYGHLSFYLNGVLQNTVVANTQFHLNNIGRPYDGWEFNGCIDEVRIYNHALNSGDVKQNYNNDHKVLYLQMDEDSWNGTSNEVVDSSGNGHHGTANGGAETTSNGKFGRAGDFTGNGDYVDLRVNGVTPVELSFTSFDAWTLTAWVYWENNPDKYWDFWIGKNGNSEMFSIASDGVIMFRQSDLNYVNLLYNYSFYENQWAHHAYVADGNGNLSFYLNGVLQNTVSATTQFHLENIGRPYNGNEFNGYIDDVYMHSRALNADEIQSAAYNSIGNWYMDEGTGIIVADFSKYNNAGILKNMTESNWVTGHLNSDGKFKTALNLDGVDDYVNCGNNDIYNLNISNTFTISCWIRPESLSTNQGIISKWGGDANSTPYDIMICSDGRIKISIANGTSSSAIYLPSSCFAIGEWRNIVATYDGSTLRGYVDGIEEASSEIDYTLTSNKNSLFIGRSSLNYYFDGDIDKVKIYSAVLGYNEIDSENPLSAFPNMTYYTSENPIAVCSLITTSISELINSYIVAKDSTGTEISSHVPVGIETEVPFNISSLHTGINKITLELRKSSGEFVAHYYIAFLKLITNPGFETKVDLQNGVVMCNNTKFFPIGFYMDTINSDNTTAFQEVSNAGFNTVLRCNRYNILPSDATTYLDNTNTYNLLVIDNLECYAAERLKSYRESAETFGDQYEIERSRILEAVGFAKQKSNLLCYYTFDEPSASVLDAGQDLYTKTNDEDGYHPTFALYSSIIPSGNNYTNWCDIIGVDPYWIPPRRIEVSRSSIDWVTKYVYLAKQRAEQDLKALWIVLLSEYWDASNKRALFPNEQRCQTWLSLIHGAKGIIYWRYPVYHDDSWNTLTDLAGKLSSLSGCMLEPDLEQSIDYYNESIPVKFDPANDQFTDIQVCLRKAPSGAGYDYVLLATNTREYSIGVDYTISLLNSGTVYRKVFDPNDSNTYNVSNGKFSDILEPFAIRAYTFSSSSTNPVTMTVDMFPNSSFIPENIHPISGRENKVNLMQNPTLEDDSLSNWPDYIQPWHYISQRINTATQSWGLVANPDLVGLDSEIVSEGGISGSAGERCLKIINNQTDTNGFLFRILPEHSELNGKEYTFSVYLKTDQAGLSAALGCADVSGAEIIHTRSFITTTTFWKRYQLTINIPVSAPKPKMFYVRLYEEGILWADAIQIEEGSSASTFTID